MTKFLPILLLAASFAAPARAQEEARKIGPVSVTPNFHTEELFDSNIYLSNTPRTNDVINKSGAGVDFGLSTNSGRDTVKLGYDATAIQYDRHPKANDAVHQTASLDLGCTTPSDWTFKAGDTALDTTDPAASEIVTRARRFQNNANLSVERKSEKLSFGIDASDTLHDYSNDTLSLQLDRSEYRAGAHVGYPIGAKTTAVLRYQYTGIAYRNGNTNFKDSTGNDVTLGVDGQIAPKIKGNVDVGVTQRAYSRNVTGLKNGFSTLGYGAGLTWMPGERTTVGLNGSRGFGESIFSTNRFYTTTVVGLGLGQKIGDKWSVSLATNYERDDYPESTTSGSFTGHRRDDNFQYRVGVGYDVTESIKLEAYDLYRSRSTNFSGFDYVDTQAGANLKILF